LGKLKATQSQQQIPFGDDNQKNKDKKDKKTGAAQASMAPE
jgi:hypothetical protein